MSKLRASTFRCALAIDFVTHLCSIGSSSGTWKRSSMR